MTSLDTGNPSECPTCGSPSSVAETRTLPGAIRRRRKCTVATCDARWTTYELRVFHQAPPNHALIAISGTQAAALRRALTVFSGLLGAPPRGQQGATATAADLTPLDVPTNEPVILDTPGRDHRMESKSARALRMREEFPGLTQAEIARRVGLDDATVSKLFRRERERREAQS